MTRIIIWLAIAAMVAVMLPELSAQPPRRNRRPPWYIEPTPETLRKVQELVGEVHDVELTINVRPNISRLIRTKRPIYRISITDPTVLDVIQHSPTEFELVGLRRGITSLTISYGDDASDLPALISRRRLLPKSMALRR